MSTGVNVVLTLLAILSFTQHCFKCYSYACFENKPNIVNNFLSFCKNIFGSIHTLVDRKGLLVMVAPSLISFIFMQFAAEI